MAWGRGIEGVSRGVCSDLQAAVGTRIARVKRHTLEG